MKYTPDCWVVLKIVSGGNTVYKVFAGWYGGYLDSDNWKLNSGITKVVDTGTHYDFYGYSGSVYNCNKSYYKMSGFMFGVLSSFQETGAIVEVMDENTVWSDIILEN